jgi:hypothetical protein
MAVKDLRESPRSWFYRKMFGLFPCYRRTGVRITFVSPDLHEIHIKLPLNWKTRGYNGTIFGGSMYACIDPIYMTMIAWHLGRDYIAWDRAATIDFRKAGRSALFSRFKLDPADVAAIRSELETTERVERVYDVVLFDSAEVVHASFRKTIVIRKRKTPP